MGRSARRDGDDDEGDVRANVEEGKKVCRERATDMQYEVEEAVADGRYAR
jgi:hypothetical protein